MNIAYAVHAPTCAAKSRWGLCGPFLDADEAMEALGVFKRNRPYTEIGLRYGSIQLIDQEFEEDAEWAKACLARERVLAELRKYTPDPAASFAYHAFIEKLIKPDGLYLAEETYRHFYRRVNGLFCANQIGKHQFDDLTDRAIDDMAKRRRAQNSLLKLRGAA